MVDSPSVRLLPRVLYRMSQVVATPTMALPVLGFLWGLIPVPALYSAFSEQQYFSVFAIALPYTAPDKSAPLESLVRPTACGAMFGCVC